MTADDRPQTAFARLGRLAADLLRPFVRLAAGFGLLIALLPPAPHSSEFDAVSWAVPPVRATVGSFPQSRWHPGALTVEALGGPVPLERVHDDDRRWEWLPAGVVVTRETTRPKDWAPSGPPPTFRSFGRGPLAEEEAAELDAILRRWRFHFQYGLTISLWPFLLAAALLAGWRVLRPAAPARPPGLLRRLARPWLWAFVLIGGAAMSGPFARAWLPDDAPRWTVNGQIGPATLPHPRLIVIEADWALGLPSPPVELLVSEQTGSRGLGLWMTSQAYPADGGMGGLGGGMGGLGGGMGAVRGCWRAHRTLRISLLWLLLPAELANLVTLFRSRPQRLAPDTPPAPA